MRLNGIPSSFTCICSYEWIIASLKAAMSSIENQKGVITLYWVNVLDLTGWCTVSYTLKINDNWGKQRSDRLEYYYLWNPRLWRKIDYSKYYGSKTIFLVLWLDTLIYLLAKTLFWQNWQKKSWMYEEFFEIQFSFYSTVGGLWIQTFLKKMQGVRIEGFIHVWIEKII